MAGIGWRTRLDTLPTHISCICFGIFTDDMICLESIGSLTRGRGFHYISRISPRMQMRLSMRALAAIISI